MTLQRLPNPEPHYPQAATLLVELQRRWQIIDDIEADCPPASRLKLEGWAHGLHVRAVALIALGLAVEARSGRSVGLPAGR